MTAPAHNQIFQFAPPLVGWLCVPLTRARRDAIPHYEARTGQSILETMIAALDHKLFNGTDRQSSGGDNYRSAAGPDITTPGQGRDLRSEPAQDCSRRAG